MQLGHLAHSPHSLDRTHLSCVPDTNTMCIQDEPQLPQHTHIHTHKHTHTEAHTGTHTQRHTDTHTHTHTTNTHTHTMLSFFRNCLRLIEQDKTRTSWVKKSALYHETAPTTMHEENKTMTNDGCRRLGRHVAFADKRKMDNTTGN